MNYLTNIKNTLKVSKKEIEQGQDNLSWHERYKHSAYIFIGGLSFNLTEGDLLTIFAQYGEIVDVKLVRDEDTGKSRGFAFLAYEDQRSTVLAVDNLAGYKLNNRAMRVEHVDNYKRRKTQEELDQEDQQKLQKQDQKQEHRSDTQAHHHKGGKGRDGTNTPNQRSPVLDLDGATVVAAEEGGGQEKIVRGVVVDSSLPAQEALAAAMKTRLSNAKQTGELKIMGGQEQGGGGARGGANRFVRKMGDKRGGWKGEEQEGGGGGWKEGLGSARGGVRKGGKAEGGVQQMDNLLRLAKMIEQEQKSDRASPTPKKSHKDKRHRHRDRDTHKNHKRDKQDKKDKQESKHYQGQSGNRQRLRSRSRSRSRDRGQP